MIYISIYITVSFNFSHLNFHTTSTLSICGIPPLCRYLAVLRTRTHFVFLNSFVPGGGGGRKKIRQPIPEK